MPGMMQGFLLGFLLAFFLRDVLARALVVASKARETAFSFRGVGSCVTVSVTTAFGCRELGSSRPLLPTVRLFALFTRPFIPELALFTLPGSNA